MPFDVRIRGARSDLCKTYRDCKRAGGTFALPGAKNAVSRPLSHLPGFTEYNNEKCVCPLSLFLPKP